jgi:hypothetical protein
MTTGRRIARRLRPWGRERRQALAVACLAAIAGACASMAAPPGGPPDDAPPVLLRTTPDSNARDARPRAVVFQFDEVISETPRGARDLAGLVFVSPRSDDIRVDWQRTRLAIRPRKGWLPNTPYVVTIAPGLVDLRNNALDRALQVVFSTGSEIPQTAISGVVFDWPAGRGANRALVQAISPDSVIYQTVSDSVGRFTLRHAPIGPYVVRAIVDRNGNQILDPLEGWDTVSVTLTGQATAELYAFPHDTIGLRVADVAVEDSSRGLKVTFDRPVALDQVFTPPQFLVRTGDSSRVIRVVRTLTAPQKVAADSAAEQAKRDSVAAAAAARADTSEAARALADSAAARARADRAAAAERDAREARRLAQLRGGRPLPPPDTTPPPKMNRPPLFTTVHLTLETALEPNTRYILEISNVTSISGTVRSPMRLFTTPRRPPPRDTAARDTTARDTSASGARRPPGDSTSPPDTTAAAVPPAGRPPTDSSRRPPPDTMPVARFPSGRDGWWRPR